jgi:isochorismate synthase
MNVKAVPDMLVDRIGDVAHFALREVYDDLDTGLALARKQAGWTFIALPAPIVALPSIVDAWRNAPVVAWSSRALTIAGIGAAHELRGAGSARWREVIAHAARLEHTTSFDRSGTGTLARPRYLGGLAFAPGAADGAPWQGFGDAWFMLPRWTYIHDGAHAALVLAVDASDAHLTTRWREELATFRAAFASSFAVRPQPPMLAIDPGDRDAWRAQVRAITDAIAAGECAKIVAARSAVVTLARDARVADMLAELDARHADCVRVLVRPPGGGSLVAATPERLVKLDGSTIACDALAGSIALSGTPDSDVAALRASTKDRNEHEIVVRAIASALHELDADVKFPVEPGVRTLRHVLHLHTPITATLRTRRHVLELAAALHPTPAVGGTPTKLATDWIASHETARGWYASPVGWFDLDGNGELAVAIRSGLLAGERAHLWAGAGIVAGSDPDRELAETDVKLRAILGALGVAA